MKSIHIARTALVCALAVLALPALVACNSSVENQDAFKTQVDRVDRNEKAVDDMHRQMALLEGDLRQMKTDLDAAAKQASGGSGTQAVAALEQRLLRLEGMVKASADTLATFNTRMEKLEKAVGSVNARVASLSSVPSRAEAREEASGKTPLVVARKGGAAMVRAEAAPSAPRGVYHEVSVGETLEQVAASYKVPVATLLAANQLPPGRRLVAGQRIYVPAKN